MPTASQNQYLSFLNRDRQRGTEAEDLYLDRAKSYDPRGALRESVGSLYDQFKQGVGRQITGLRGRLARSGGGRLASGYGELDESEAVYDMERDLNRNVSGLALQAEGLNLRNQEGLGQYGQNTTGRYTDLLSGQIDRETAERNAKRQQKGSLWGSLASVAGSVLGGPIGGMIGKGVGSLFDRSKRGG